MNDLKIKELVQTALLFEQAMISSSDLGLPDGKEIAKKAFQYANDFIKIKEDFIKNAANKK